MVLARRNRRSTKRVFGTSKREGVTEIVMTTNQLYISRLITALRGAGSSTVIRHRERDISGEALLSLIFQYARALRQLGIGPGKLLGLLAPNRPEAIAARYGAHVLGAATVYLPDPSTEARRAALVHTIAPHLLVVLPETCLGACNGLPYATVGFDLKGSAGRLDELAAAAPRTVMPVMARPGDLAVVSSSGGSTGVPKGSCRDFLTYSQMASAPADSGRVQLINGPLAYLSQVLVDVVLGGGGCIVLQDRYVAADTLAAIEAERITHLFLVEPQLFEMMDHPDVDRRDLTSLRSLTHIGASAPPCLRLRARRRLGPILEHTYGASEMGIVSMLPADEHDPSRPATFTSAGRIRPGVEIRFRRADGRLAAPGEAGAIEVRSPGMASGYRNNPGLTAEHFRDGWYASGDLGRLDDGGFLHVRGRAADAQHSGGTLVMPVDLEEAICNVPGVRYAVVIKDDATGSDLAAIVPENGLQVDRHRVRRTVAAQFGRDLATSLVMIGVSHIPMTEQGKPDRAAIEALARRQIAA